MVVVCRRHRLAGWLLGSAVTVAPATLLYAQNEPAAAPAAPAAQVTADASSNAVQGGTIHGTVAAGEPGKPGSVPLPGVAVTATNTLTGRKYTAATDIDGHYAMTIPRNGRYVVRAELTGFALATAEVIINGDAAANFAKHTDFGMELASRAAAAEARQQAASNSTGAARGLQGLSLTGTTDSATTDIASAGNGNTGVSMPSLSGLQDSGGADSAGAATDTIAVSGQSGQMNGLANFSEDDIRQRVQEAVDRARSSGMLPQGAGDPTNMIVGALGGMMGGMGPGGGGPGGGGRGGRGGGGGGGGSFAFRGFNPAQPHGGLNYSGEFAALDSAPWSPTLQPVPNPSYFKNTFGATFAGSPYIPGLTKPDTKQFVFLNLNGQRNTTPQVLTAIVPTLAQRNGVFTGQSTIYDPLTGKPFANNVIPGGDPAYGGVACTSAGSCLNQQAASLALSNYYPLCNIAGCETSPINRFNYQEVTTAGQNSANLSARYVRNFGKNAGGGPFGGLGRRNQQGPPALRQNINANFSYSHSASDQRNYVPILGGATLSEGYNFGVGYTIGYGRLSNTATVNWNRSHAQTRNYFTDTPVDPSADLGITRPDDHAIGFRPNFYNGLTALQFNGFSSINNTNPSETIGQTISYSDSAGWRHGKLNMRFGFDIRRVHQDSLGGGNPLGSIVFTGYNTQSTADQQCTAGLTNGNCTTKTGIAFADFLLGRPQQSKVQAGLDKIYLRENVFDAYALNDHRVNANVTLNYGLRYEYFAPYTEKNGRLVNLTGVTTQTTSVGCVTPNGLSDGALNCGVGPDSSLIHPDRTMWSPRIGIAWHPKKLKETVIRAGYGINYNTAQFATFAKLLSYQAPFATVQNNVLQTDPTNPTGCTTGNMLLSNAFTCSNKLFQNSFAVNPNYRLGMVQVYNFDIQRSLPWGIVMNVGYNGSRGSGLDVVRAPNHNFNRVTTTNAVAFTYEDSIATSNFNALTINARKRLQHGLAMGATYQYAHSIDDASTFGGASSTTSIQDDSNLLGERSNSSFDVRHKLTGNWLYELPVGPNRKFLNKGGVAAAILDGFSLSGNFTFASGSYYTPSFQSSAAQIAAGGTYTLRPDRDFTQSITGAGTLHSFFNKAAFINPCPQGALASCTQDHYGSASRYSIEGLGQLVIDAALSRTVKLGETRSFEARMAATNVFNTVQYSGIDTVVNSATFGQVTSAAAMRRIVFTGRFRF